MSYILIGPGTSSETANKLHELAPWLNSCHRCIWGREARVVCTLQCPKPSQEEASHCALTHQLLSLGANVDLYECIHTQTHTQCTLIRHIYTQCTLFHIYTHICTHIHTYMHIDTYAKLHLTGWTWPCYIQRWGLQGFVSLRLYICLLILLSSLHQNTYLFLICIQIHILNIIRFIWFHIFMYLYNLLYF